MVAGCPLLAPNAEVVVSWTSRSNHLTCKCCTEADCPVVIAYIATREERRHPTKYMEKYSPDGNTTTIC